MYKSPKTKVTEFFSPVKKAVVNAAATAMSAPKVMMHKRRMKQADHDADMMKKAREYEGMPSFETGIGPTEAGKARALAAAAKARTLKRAKKLKGN